MSKSMKLKLATLALGGVSLVVTGENGCRNAITADIVRGVGNAGIASGIDSAFGAVNNTNLNQYVKTPVTDAFTNAWNNFVTVNWPTSAVTQEIFSR